MNHVFLLDHSCDDFLAGTVRLIDNIEDFLQHVVHRYSARVHCATISISISSYVKLIFVVFHLFTNLSSLLLSFLDNQSPVRPDNLSSMLQHSVNSAKTEPVTHCILLDIRHREQHERKYLRHVQVSGRTKDGNHLGYISVAFYDCARTKWMSLTCFSLDTECAMWSIFVKLTVQNVHDKVGKSYWEIQIN